MSIIIKMRKQTAIYWAFADFDEYGQPTYDDPVEISCRWEDSAVEYIDPEGNRNVSDSVVYVDRDMAVKGVLMLGELDSSVDEDNPLQNEGASEIMQFSKVPNLKATEYLRTAYL